jgi:alkaline phosphatase
VPWISDAWTSAFALDAAGELSDEQRAKLRWLAQRAHAQDRLLRFWGAPDDPDTWEQLAAAGVDWISTDRLAEFAAWQRAR